MYSDFLIIDGVLKKYIGSDTVVTIPDGVTIIGNEVFKDKSTLTEIIMPDSVTEIGKSAFENCAKLNSVVFSKQLTKIESYAFNNCKSLKKIELPDTLVTLKSGVFANCTKLSQITCNSPVFKPEANPFASFSQSNCKLLFDKNGFLIFANTLYCYKGNEKVVTVPDGITCIAEYAFCTSFTNTSVYLPVTKVVLPDSVKIIGAYAFYNCQKLKEITLPEDVRIGIDAFSNCSELADENGFVIINKKLMSYIGKSAEIVIPEGVEYLEHMLFDSTFTYNRLTFRHVTRVVLPQTLKQIPNCAFKCCLSLEEINFPESLESIGASAFACCEKLKNVDIPKTVKLSDETFCECPNMADENGFVIVNDVLYYYVGNQTNVVVPENVKCISGKAFQGKPIKTVKLPDGLEYLGAAFDGCESLEEIEIPEGITSIAPRTFNNCKSLKKITLPSTLTSIGTNAFYSCESLSEIQIPDGVKAIGTHAFMSCSSLKSIRFPAATDCISESVCSCCLSLETVIIEDGIKLIKYKAFNQCVSLKSVSIPQSVDIIEDSAFGSCRLLEDVTFGNPNCYIDLSAFPLCYNLIDKNGFKIIAGTLISYSGKHNKVTIPETVHTIAPDAFREGIGCSHATMTDFRNNGSLHEIIIPDTVKVIGSSAFRKCNKLTSVSIPESVDYIGDDAFTDCTELKNIFVEKGNKNYTDIDGVLYNADKTTLICFPAGKEVTEFTVADSVQKIADRALINSSHLVKLVIPASVKHIGSEIFSIFIPYLEPINREVHVAFGAGSEHIGENAFMFDPWDLPLVYPELSVNFPKEHKTQVRLSLGFCQFPEKYSGKYAEEYRNYVLKNQRIIIRKAEQLGLNEVVEYFNKNADGTNNENVVYKPDLSVKRPSELRKVEILEETVRKGTLADLEAVLKTYKTFELTARALGYAARYRGADFVRLLADHGATFSYVSSIPFQSKYKTEQQTVSGGYKTEYSLMLIPDELDFSKKRECYAYDYSPMYGISYMHLEKEDKEKTLPLSERLEVLKVFIEHKNLEAPIDELLFWSLVTEHFEFADILIESGADLDSTPPSYYSSYPSNNQTYMSILTSTNLSVYRSSFVAEMAKLDSDKVLPVLERISSLLNSAEKKLVVTQKLYEEIKWNDESFAFAMNNFDFSKVNKKKTMEAAICDNNISFLETMAEAGWLAQASKLFTLIEFAQKNNSNEALAWLIDYRNKNVDVAAEEAKAEAKMLRELTEKPDSVSAMKKIWRYKKLEDNTLIITGYKGTDTDVVFPAKIGKNNVSAIGEYVFGWTLSRVESIRNAVTSIIIPEGITKICSSAFKSCTALTSVTLPSTLTTIEDSAFSGCKELSSVILSENTQNFEGLIFYGCDKLSHDGFVILNNILFRYTGDNEVVEIPSGVTRIAPQAFKFQKFIKKIVIPDTVEIIGSSAFEQTGITEITIPESVKTIESEAFMYCRSLHEFFIPAKIKNIADDCFGWSFEKYIFHTAKNAPIAKFLAKNYPGSSILFDYESK